LVCLLVACAGSDKEPAKPAPEPPQPPWMRLPAAERTPYMAPCTTGTEIVKTFKKWPEISKQPYEGPKNGPVVTMSVRKDPSDKDVEVGLVSIDKNGKPVTWGALHPPLDPVVGFVDFYMFYALEHGKEMNEALLLATGEYYCSVVL